MDFNFLSESEALLERLRATDIAWARRRFEKGEALSDRDREVLGVAATVQHSDHDDDHDARVARVIKAIRPKGIQFRSELLQRLNDHAADLAVRHNIIVERSEDRWCAFQEERRISVPAVTNEYSYATFLHEVGHIVSPDADSRQYANKVADVSGYPGLISVPGEIGAWHWAVANALTWTREMQDSLFRGLKFYNRHHMTDDDDVQPMRDLVRFAWERVDGRNWSTEALDQRLSELVGHAKSFFGEAPAASISLKSLDAATGGIQNDVLRLVRKDGERLRKRITEGGWP